MFHRSLSGCSASLVEHKCHINLQDTTMFYACLACHEKINSLLTCINHNHVTHVDVAGVNILYIRIVGLKQRFEYSCTLLTNAQGLIKYMSLALKWAKTNLAYHHNHRSLLILFWLPVGRGYMVIPTKLSSCF